MNGDNESRTLGGDDVIALLGRGSAFEGKLTFEGTVRIDGTFSGEVFSDDTLVIGEGALVQATVDVGTLIVHGNLEGDVRAAALIDLRAPGRLIGDIAAPSVMIEKGAYFEGACSMSGEAEEPAVSRPAAAVPRKAEPAAPKAAPVSTAAPARSVPPLAPTLVSSEREG